MGGRASRYNSTDPDLEDRLAATTQQSAKRPSYATLLLALAPLALVGTLVLWWLGSLPDEAHPEVGRVVFGNIPAPIVARLRFSRISRLTDQPSERNRAARWSSNSGCVGRSP